MGIELGPVLKGKKEVESILSNTKMSDVEEPRLEVEEPEV